MHTTSLHNPTMTFVQRNLVLLVIACLVFHHAHLYAVAGSEQCNAEDASCSADTATKEHDMRNCNVVLGVRNDGNAGNRKFGIFANAPLQRGMPLPPSIRSDITGDVVVHLVDVPSNENNTSQLDKWLSQGYLVDALSSGYGGNYEGNGRVLTALPGIGMMASSFQDHKTATGSTDSNGSVEISKRGPNVWAAIPTTDEANHPRRYSPLAGSFALNYNLTFRAIHPFFAGDEVFVDRSGWFRSNSLKGASNNDGKSAESGVQYEMGVCLDSNIYPSYAKKGRGAFASKSIEEGSVLAYSPVLPLPRHELRYVRKKDKKKKDAVWRDQLLLNYCFGHSNSSVLLYPYGSFVNYINHAPSTTSDNDTDSKIATANVRVRWSEKLISNVMDPRTLTPSELWNRPSPEGLVLEYVALKKIQPNEEILIDYGSVWVNAWKEHVKQWKKDPSNNEGGPDAIAESSINDYSPAYIVEDVISNLRTAEEQISFPYEGNVFTACFYKYERTETNNEVKSSAKTLNQAIPWKMSRGLFDMINLRPCKVISREPATDRRTGRQDTKKNFYTAIIQNRPGLPENERIPNGVKHIVSGIPREAFRFVDKPYSSDEHLDGAFRHHIGLDETGIFPDSWLDTV